MLTNYRTNRILWLLAALPALLVSLYGVVNPELYSRVVSNEIMPGVISQDLTTIIASSLVLVLLALNRPGNPLHLTMILGMMGYLFYAYGTYALERVYNEWYFVYMAIFALSFYSILFTVVGICKNTLRSVFLPKKMRGLAIGFTLLVPAIFYPLWIDQLLPLVREGRKIEFLYSVFVLDLCLIMPLFLILAYRAFKKDGLALFLLPALFIFSFTLLLPVGVGEFFKPSYGLEPDMAGVGLFLGFSVMFFALAVVYIRKMELRAPVSSPAPDRTQ